MDNMGDDLMLICERIILREIEENDLKFIVEWRNDPDIRNYLFSYLPLSMMKQRRWYEQYSVDSTKQIFIIELKKEKRPIGTIGLTDIDYKNQKAEMGILVERSVQKIGIGTDSLNLLLTYAYDEMNLRKITAKVFDDNSHAIRLYEKLGFIREGLLKKDIFKTGEYKNVVIMAKFK